MGQALRCYSGCGKTNIAGAETNIPCNTSTEIDCPSGEVCSTQSYSYEYDLSGNKTKRRVIVEDCAAKSVDTDAMCDDFEVLIEGILIKPTCDFKFCESDLCNSGFTAHVSFLSLVLSAGVLMFGLQLY